MSGTVVTLPLSPLTMALNLPSSQLIKLYLPSYEPDRFVIPTMNNIHLTKLLTFKQTNYHKAVSRSCRRTINSIF